MRKKNKNECPWYLYLATAENGRWLVGSYNIEHICLHSRQIRAATASFFFYTSFRSHKPKS